MMCSATWRKPAARQLQTTLAQIPSFFGRLLYLARCRDRDGSYSHLGMSLSHDPNEVSQLLRREHAKAWRHWLQLPLLQQHQDLLQYLAGTPKRGAITSWLKWEPWHELAPQQSPPNEKQLFETDFRALLRVLAA